MAWIGGDQHLNPWPWSRLFTYSLNGSLEEGSGSGSEERVTNASLMWCVLSSVSLSDIILIILFYVVYD